MNAGDLVSDELMMDLVRERLSQAGRRQGLAAGRLPAHARSRR